MRVERLAHTFYTNFNFLIPISSQPDVKTLIFHTTANKSIEIHSLTYRGLRHTFLRIFQFLWLKYTAQHQSINHYLKTTFLVISGSPDPHEFRWTCWRKTINRNDDVKISYERVPVGWCPCGGDAPLGVCPCGGMYLWGDVPVGRCPCGKMSLWVDVPVWGMSLWGYVPVGVGVCPCGKMSLWEYVPVGVCPYGPRWFVTFTPKKILHFLQKLGFIIFLLVNNPLLYKLQIWCQ